MPHRKLHTKPKTSYRNIAIATIQRGPREARGVQFCPCAFIARKCSRANFLDLSLMHPGFYPVCALTVRWLLFAVCRFVSDVRFSRFFVVPSSFQIVGYLFAVRPLRMLQSTEHPSVRQLRLLSKNCVSLYYIYVPCGDRVLCRP